MAITVYGAGWCGDTKMTLAQLERAGVAFDYRDVDADAEAAAWVREQNGGKQKLPTVDIDGRVLSVPDEETLLAAMGPSGT